MGIQRCFANITFEKKNNTHGKKSGSFPCSVINISSSPSLSSFSSSDSPSTLQIQLAIKVLSFVSEHETK